MLLILAGVSISLVVGQNGVLTRASDSATRTKMSQMEEAFQLAVSSCQTDYFNNFANTASAGYKDALDGVAINKALNAQGYQISNSSTSITNPSAGDGTDEKATWYIYSKSENSGSSDHLYVEYQAKSGTDVSFKFGTDLKGTAPGGTTTE